MAMSPEAHGQHMEMVKGGLEQIMASNDINQIKQIAQSLLGAEQEEQVSEEVVGEGGDDAMMNAVKSQMGA